MSLSFYLFKYPSLSNIYPNPNNGQVIITLNNLSDVNINIYSVSGKLVYTANLENTESHKINLNGDAGLYLLEVSSKEGKQYHKLMKN